MNTIKVVGMLILALSCLCLGCPAPDPEEVTADAIVEEQSALEEGEEPGMKVVSLPTQVQKAVDIGRAIEENPDRIEAILEEAGITADAFEELLFDIAADPELSRLYTEAMANDQ